MGDHDSAILLKPGPLPSRVGKQRNFRFSWIGEPVSLPGTQVIVQAMPLTAFQLFDATAERVGILRFPQPVPYLAPAVFTGGWTDRARRRPIMLAANVPRHLLLVLVPALYWLDHPTLGGQMALAAVAIGSTLTAIAVWLSPVSHVRTLPIGIV